MAYCSFDVAARQFFTLCFRQQPRGCRHRLRCSCSCQATTRRHHASAFAPGFFLPCSLSSGFAALLLLPVDADYFVSRYDAALRLRICRLSCSRQSFALPRCADAGFAVTLFSPRRCLLIFYVTSLIRLYLPSIPLLFMICSYFTAYTPDAIFRLLAHAIYLSLIIVFTPRIARLRHLLLLH